jgi:[acyl-carrier-protein] S-malonyltransferase
LSDNHLAFIFPAFTSDYNDHPGRNMPGFEQQFNIFLERAANFIDPKLSTFDFIGSTFPGDELRNQFITYIYSCAASVVLRGNKFVPGVSAGYSMGIYAALFDSRAITFETGLSLIGLAWNSLHHALRGKKYGMGTIIGLRERDIEEVISGLSLETEITNTNALFSYVVSGVSEDVKKLLEYARKEGALHTRYLETSIPYHSKLLKAGADEFAKLTDNLDIKAPESHVISLIDQKLLSTPESARDEIVNNLYHQLNWYRTMQVMIASQVTHFIECGPSRGLVKNAKFIDGTKHFYGLNSIPVRR